MGHSCRVSTDEDTDGGALLFPPATPVLAPISPDHSSPIPDFSLESPAFMHPAAPTYNLVPNLSGPPPSALAASRFDTPTPDLFSESPNPLRATDLTLNQINQQLTILTHELLTAHTECHQLREDLAEASAEWGAYMDKLRAKIARQEHIIRTLEGKCASSPRAACADGTGCELEVRRRVRGRLVRKLAWAERQWEGLDVQALECAEMAVRGLEERVEYLWRVREVVMLTEDGE